jgi:diaminopimelate epimerase
VSAPRTIRLVKAHAYGNDFLILAEADVPAEPGLPEIARRACDRHRGIGADGLLVVRDTPGGASMRLFNADGSRSELSGNGVRCLAAWIAATRRLGPGTTVAIDSEAGRIDLTLLDRTGGHAVFRAAMGAPEELREEELEVAGQTITAVVLRVGNPQCVVLGPLSTERLETIAAGLATHPFFPEGTNVELATVERADRVRILIWERGVGPTESSGTGTCAAAVAAAAYGGAARTVDVIAPGGTQRVEWTSEGLWLTGGAEVIGTVEWWT